MVDERKLMWWMRSNEEMGVVACLYVFRDEIKPMQTLLNSGRPKKLKNIL